MTSTRSGITEEEEIGVRTPQNLGASGRRTRGRRTRTRCRRTNNRALSRIHAFRLLLVALVDRHSTARARTFASPAASAASGICCCLASLELICAGPLDSVTEIGEGFAANRERAIGLAGRRNGVCLGAAQSAGERLYRLSAGA